MSNRRTQLTRTLTFLIPLLLLNGLLWWALLRTVQTIGTAPIAYALAQSRYRAGTETMLTVLTAQQTLYAAQGEAAPLKQARWQASIVLYQALGGGRQAPSAADDDRDS